MSLTQARADDEVLADETPENTAQRQPHVIDLGVNFDTNLFDRNGNSWTIRGGNVAIRGQIVRGGRGGNLVIMDAAAPEPESPALARARGAGQKRIEQIDSACGLSDAQRARLELAVESDARRFAADIDATRARYQGRQVNMNDPAGQKEWHAFQQDVQRCRERLRQLFDSSSLLVTSLGTTLDEQQFASLFEEQSARRTYQWKALVAEALTRLDDTLALNETQHAAIEAFLIDREPPLRSDIAPKAIADSNLRRNLVLMVLAEVDAKELRAAVSDRQWRTLGGLTSQGRAMRSWIEQQGVLETGTTKTKSQSRVRSR
jgi:hypothetical protein